MRIAAIDEGALALGIAPGMMLADARARVPDLEALPHDPVADAALLETLADGCERYSPSVAPDPPDGLILDIAGCAQLWGGEAGLTGDLAGWLIRAGMTIRIAIAETPDKARALARHGGEWLRAGRGVPPEALNDARSAYRAETGAHQEDARVLALPLAALDPDPDAQIALRRAGLVTIGDLAARPRGPLAARFGAALADRLARVLGEEDVRISPRRTPPALFFQRRFADPVAREEHVLKAIGDLAKDAATALAARGSGGRRFAVCLFRSDGAVHRLAIETARAARDPALVVRLFGERIASLADPLDPGFGYDAIRLSIPLAEPLGPAQAALDGGAGAQEDLAALADRLGVRLGRARIRRFAFAASHMPECAGFAVPAHLPSSGPAPQPEAPGDPPLRPLRLFDPPQPVEAIAEVPDGPPRRFRWRGRTHDVVAHEGPERIAAEWWKRKEGHMPGKGGLTRDYYRVEDSRGRRFWLFRHGLYGAEKANPAWYLHGAFA